MENRPKNGPGSQVTGEEDASAVAMLAGPPFGEKRIVADERSSFEVRSKTARTTLYRYAVVITLGLFVLGFSLLLPRTFFTLGNFRTIVSSQAVLMIVALGLTLPLTTGEFDLSIGAMLGCAAVLTALFLRGSCIFRSLSWSQPPCRSVCSRVSRTRSSWSVSASMPL